MQGIAVNKMNDGGGRDEVEQDREDGWWCGNVVRNAAKYQGTDCVVNMSSAMLTCPVV